MRLGSIQQCITKVIRTSLIKRFALYGNMFTSSLKNEDGVSLFHMRSRKFAYKVDHGEEGL
jgi:hypothetical protein